MSSQLASLRAAIEEKDKNCAEHIQLLNEAGEEYTDAMTEIRKLKEKITSLMVRGVRPTQSTALQGKLKWQKNSNYY